jgi:hypothetical protein
MEQLTQLSTQFNSGKEAEILQALGPYANLVGADIDGLSEIQAYQAIISKIAPTLKVPGSGATSDFEMQNFLLALPGIGKTPEANALISETFTAIAEVQSAAAYIANQAMAGEITSARANQMLAELPNPLASWVDAGRPGAPGSDAGGAGGGPIQIPMPGGLPPATFTPGSGGAQPQSAAPPPPQPGLPRQAVMTGADLIRGGGSYTAINPETGERLVKVNGRWMPA